MVVVSFVVLFAPSSGGAGSLFPESDKVVHLLLFGGLAATTRWRFGPGLTGLGAVAGFAVLSELVQAAVLPSRSGDPLDVVADLAGAALGWVLVARSIARRSISRC